MGDIERELDALLAQDATAMQASERGEFDRLSCGRPIVLMGAGGLGRMALSGLRKHGVEPLAFADNAASKQGTTLDGLQVLSPAAAARQFGRRAAFVVTIWGANGPHRFSHSRDQLHAHGCDLVCSFPPLFWKYAEDLLPHYLQDLPSKLLNNRADVRRAFTLWEDDGSRREYLAQVRLRLYADFDGLPHPAAHSQYFPPDLFSWRDDEWVVDGGAYDGDTIRSLLKHHEGRFAHVLAVEPDPINYTRLTTTVESLPAGFREKITCLPIALAAHSSTLHLSATGTEASSTASLASLGSTEVAAQPLDELVHSSRPTFVKLDIEGFEPYALTGGWKTIREHGPVVAVCVYHHQDHLWRIPLLLRECRDDFAFFLRPHNEEGWDLVCYAVPRSRLTWNHN